MLQSIIIHCENSLWSDQYTTPLCYNFSVGSQHMCMAPHHMDVQPGSPNVQHFEPSEGLCRRW